MIKIYVCAKKETIIRNKERCVPLEVERKKNTQEKM